MKRIYDPAFRNRHRLYLRIGRNFGASKFGLDEEWQQETGKRYESGVSVYFVFPFYKEGRVQFIVRKPVERRAMYGLRDYWENMFGTVLRSRMCNEEIFLVRGRLIPILDDSEYAWEACRAEGADEAYTYDVGSDGEPVLQVGSVRIAARVSLGQLLTDFYLDDRGNYAVGDMLSPGWGWGKPTLKQLYDSGEFCNE